MNFKTIVITFFLFFCVTKSYAYTDKEFGLGIILGSPTGFSGNFLLSNTTSIDAALAYDLGDDSNFHIHADYLFRFPKSLPFDGETLGWYWGIGAKFRTHNEDNNDQDDEDFRFGPRGSAGLNYEFKKAPVEIFGEIALIMYLIESTDLDADIALGARYYW
jgi:hypothetical protein